MVAMSLENAALLDQLTSTGHVDVVVDIPSTALVILALAATMAAVWFSIRFARTARGELGAAFRFVNIGVWIFAGARAFPLARASSRYRARLSRWRARLSRWRSSISCVATRTCHRR